MIQCDACRGSGLTEVRGKTDWFTVGCEVCDGTGEVAESDPSDGNTSRVDQPYDLVCPDCRGSGTRIVTTGFGLNNWQSAPCLCPLGKVAA